jgi:hypothetical protein
MVAMAVMHIIAIVPDVIKMLRQANPFRNLLWREYKVRY